MTSHVAEKFEDKKNDLVVKDFGGVNTQASRTAIAENEFAWLENLMPVGFANLRAVPHQGDAVASIVGTIAAWKYVNIANVDYLAILTAGGGASVLNLSDFSFTTIAIDGAFTPPVAVAQWKNERLLFVDASGYYSWDGTLLLGNGAVIAVAVTNAGTAYTAIPTITFTGGGGLNATARVAMRLVGTQVVTAAGTNYGVGDLVSLSGGTYTQIAKLRVDTVGGAGDITAVSIYQSGTYTVLPASPNTVIGGTGSGATITTAWGVDTVTITNGADVAYLTAPTVTFSASAGVTATGTAELLAGPDGGQWVVTFSGRVWVAKDRTWSYSAPDSFSDFTIDSAGGSFIVTDEVLTSSITGAYAANNFLYYWGASSIAVISDVRVVPGTPYVTVFSNTNVSAIIGTDLPYSIFPYYRTIGFATRYGFYALVGATPQKISDQLDGMIGAIDFTRPVTGDVVKIFNILGMAFCFRYDDPTSGPRALLAIYFNKKWFFASQGDAIDRVEGAFQAGVPALFGTDGTNIYKLFSDEATSVDATLKTALWPMKEPTRTKQTLKGGVELTATVDVISALDVQVDTNSSTYSTQLIADSLGAWVNTAGTSGAWINTALEEGNWITTGFQIFQGNIEAFGRYIGYTVNLSAPAFAIEGLLLQYERKSQWATKAV